MFIKNSGVITAVLAYSSWGILPLYWKLLDNVAADEIITYRIICSFVFMFCLVLILGMQKKLKDDWKVLIAKKNQLKIFVLGACLISFNWLVYIWAVNDNRILETSLGYYIAPLASVFIGVLFLKEKLYKGEVLGIVLAVLGVVYMAVNTGGLPWVALLLAISVSLYSLCKKMVRLDALSSMTLETMLITPIALVYLSYLHVGGTAYSLDFSWTTVFLLGTGVVTAIPLLLFVNGVNKLPLTVLGFIQYVSPTIAFLVGVFVYDEPFTDVHVISFSLIWLAVIVFTGANFFKNKKVIKVT